MGKDTKWTILFIDVEVAEMKIRISVVIPVYNRLKELGNCLNSLNSQTDKDFEVIVVDDGGNLNYDELFASYSGTLNYIKLPVNYGGPSVPRNIGVENARGNYILFCDSDDTFRPNKIERIRQTIKIGEYPNFIYHLMQKPDGTLIGREYKGQETLKRYGNVMPLSSWGVKKAVLQEIGGFNKDLAGVEDYDWILRYLNSYKSVEFIDEILGDYIMSTDSLSVVNTRLLRSYEGLLKQGHFISLVGVSIGRYNVAIISHKMGIKRAMKNLFLSRDFLKLDWLRKLKLLYLIFQ